MFPYLVEWCDTISFGDHSGMCPQSKKCTTTICLVNLNLTIVCRSHPQTPTDPNTRTQYNLIPVHYVVSIPLYIFAVHHSVPG